MAFTLKASSLASRLLKNARLDLRHRSACRSSVRNLPGRRLAACSPHSDSARWHRTRPTDVTLGQVHARTASGRLFSMLRRYGVWAGHACTQSKATAARHALYTAARPCHAAELVRLLCGSGVMALVSWHKIWKATCVDKADDALCPFTHAMSQSRVVATAVVSQHYICECSGNSAANDVRPLTIAVRAQCVRRSQNLVGDSIRGVYQDEG